MSTILAYTVAGADVARRGVHPAESSVPMTDLDNNLPDWMDDFHVEALRDAYKGAYDRAFPIYWRLDDNNAVVPVN
jgi:hypothetical protein